MDCASGTWHQHRHADNEEKNSSELTDSFLWLLCVRRHATLLVKRHSSFFSRWDPVLTFLRAFPLYSAVLRVQCPSREGFGCRSDFLVSCVHAIRDTRKWHSCAAVCLCGHAWGARERMCDYGRTPYRGNVYMTA